MPVSKPSRAKRRMPLSKRSRAERDAPGSSRPTGQRKLYLILDDCHFGYSIRELDLNSSIRERELDDLPTGGVELRLPPPFLRLEAMRGRPEFFTAVGTKILATHPRYSIPEPILPLVDVRSRGVNFAPGELFPERPIYIPVGDDEIFALDMDKFKVLSMKPLWPPRQEFDYPDDLVSEWLWQDLPMPTLFNRMDVTSHAVDSDGHTILVSTAGATFAFNTKHHVWEKRAEWSLPFSGRAYFVHGDGLDVFVGLPKDSVGAPFGHLCFCRMLSDGDKHVWFSKENYYLSSSKPPPATNLVGTTLVYLGESRFCLLECFNNADDKAVQNWIEAWEAWAGPDYIVDLERGPCPLSTRCYLTTFSLNSALTAVETAVRCYRLPVEASFDVNPVAFWL